MESPVITSAQKAARDLQRVERKLKPVRRLLAQCEAVYMTLGLQYHALPLHIRGVEQDKDCEDDFIIKQGGEDPEIVKKLIDAKHVLDLAQEQLRAAAAACDDEDWAKTQRDVSIAKTHLVHADEATDDIREWLIVTGLRVQWIEFKTQEVYEKEHGRAYVSASDREPETFPMLDAWLLRTPEGQHIVQDLEYSNDHAIIMALALAKNSKPLADGEDYGEYAEGEEDEDVDGMDTDEDEYDDHAEGEH